MTTDLTISNIDHQTFVVFGTPRPQGSGSLIRSKDGRNIKKQSNTMVGWRNVVVDAFVNQKRGMFEEGPVRVDVEFRFARPKSHSKARAERDGGIKSDGPDIDKLCRLVLDALTIAKVVDDDRQVSELVARKRYTSGPADPEGVFVIVCREGENK